MSEVSHRGRPEMPSPGNGASEATRNELLIRGTGAVCPKLNMGSAPMKGAGIRWAGRAVSSVFIVASFCAGCALHSAPSFETASEPPQEPRRPDGVAVDLEGSLPAAETRGLTGSALVPLKEPVDVSQAMQAVRTFFRAISAEDLEAMESVLTSDAQQLPLGSGNGMPAARHWEQRFRKLDYTALGSEPMYRESMVETYRYEDLDETMAGRPIRPAAMTTDNVLIRVPVTRTRLGVDRVFGPEILFVLRREGRNFEIQTLHEDFTAP